MNNGCWQYYSNFSPRGSLRELWTRPQNPSADVNRTMKPFAQPSTEGYLWLILKEKGNAWTFIIFIFIYCGETSSGLRNIHARKHLVETNLLKTMDTIGNCQSEIIINEKTPKLWATRCLILRPQILNLRSWNRNREKLLLSLKLRHFRESRFSQCFILSISPHYLLLSKVLC